MATLRSDPDWIGSAQAFAAGLAAQADLEGRVVFVEACRAELGDQVYPAFVKLLAAVAAFGDAPARALCAEALAHALATSRLPSTRVPAWGGGAAALSRYRAGGLATNLRTVGPIEFLCIWLTRDLVEEPLDETAFRTALTWILTLFNASDRASKLYRAKLVADAENPMEGLYSQESRSLIRALTAAWEAGAEPAEVAARAVAARVTPPHNPFAALGR